MSDPTPALVRTLAPVLEVRALTKTFPMRVGLFAREDGEVHAVDGVNLSLAAGETLGLVGESGCGKSTLARLLVRLHEPSSGEVLLKGRDFLRLQGAPLKAARAEIQMIFQDPYGSLNPRMSIGRILEEPFRLHGVKVREERKSRVRALLEQVGLDADAEGRYPHEFSGGQRQRVGIARAIALEPDVVICDEPVSALDVSIQAQVLNLLLDLQERLGLSYLFISHDLAVVRHISDRIAVMYLGRIVELAETAELFENPAHPYTRALLQSVPIADPKRRGHREPLEGDVPSPRARPSGCHFHTRCAYAVEECRQKSPMLTPLRTASQHQVACHLAHQGLLPKAEPLAR